VAKMLWEEEKKGKESRLMMEVEGDRLIFQSEDRLQENRVLSDVDVEGL
jgi:hypothetical protein